MAMTPDWQGILRCELAEVALGSQERREIIVELAAHLEDTCESYLRQGLSHDEAVRRTLAQAGDWDDLRLRIQIARREEEIMTGRVKQFWLPGFLTLFVSMLLLMVIQFIGPRPLVVGMHGWRMMAPVAVIYLPWLFLLLPIGALGAYLSGRAGASQRTTFLSIVFPVLPYLVLFIIAFPVSLIVDDHVAHSLMFSALFIGLLAWVLLPGIALLAGGLPVCHLLSRRTASL
jgi:hypothetical protein